MDDDLPKYDEHWLSQPATRYELWEAVMTMRLYVSAFVRTLQAAHLEDLEKYDEAREDAARTEQKLDSICNRLLRNSDEEAQQ